MRRRTFIVGLGSVPAWPIVARTQQQAKPVVGFLGQGTTAAAQSRLDAVRQGLSEVGYIEGRNVAIETRFAEGQFDRLPALAADLVRRQVAVIIANGPAPARAAKTQSNTIPIVFGMGEDPVNESLVASLNRPGGNITGYTNFSNRLLGKPMELLREIVPNATRLALLVNPNNPNAGPDMKDAQASAVALGRQLRELRAKTEAISKGHSPRWFKSRSADCWSVSMLSLKSIVNNWRRWRFDTVSLQFSSTVEMYRQVGIYTGRILKGEKPANLPVLQRTKFELVINLKTARALGLTIPETLLATADEVIQ
jgi:putative ABC transport system substrate-binding protein